MTNDTPNLNADDIPKSASPQINNHYRLQWEQAQAAYVLLYPEGMIKLNFSGGEILKRCDGERTVQAIIDDLVRSFPEAPEIEPDVLEFIAVAKDKQWINLVGL